MSRWLSGLNQVSNLLEQLDDRVENVAEERALGYGDDDAAFEEDAQNILAKRGLLAETNDGEQGADEEKTVENMDLEAAEEEVEVVGSASVDEDVGASKEVPSKPESLPLATESDKADSAEASVNAEPNENDEAETKEQPKDIESQTSSVSNQEPPRAPVQTQVAKSPVRTSRPTNQTDMKATKEAQKEVRGLRRHIVKLNTELEHAEKEVAALRDELNNAGSLMDKELGKLKTRMEKDRKESTDKLESQKAKYEENIKEEKTKHEQQCKDYEARIADMENQRKQDGGDWSKERAQAMEREQDISGQVAQLEDEKAVLLAQVGTLQSQQIALGSRLESLSEASESAMARAREAEDKLDETLGHHAKQISQRQSREVELQQTIQELNAALVVAKSQKGKSTLPKMDGAASAETTLVRQIHTLEDDLSAVSSQLALEKEKGNTLQSQLKEMIKESSQEASSAQVKILQYQRDAADMKVTISRLTTELQNARNSTSNNGSDMAGGAQDGELADQIKHLSEELFRLREKLADANSTSLTLKTKLKTARDQAAAAEEKLTLATMNSGNGFDGLHRSSSNGGMTRRVRSGATQAGSMRSALLLSSAQGEQVEKIGKAVDVVDSFAVSTGKYLRRNPLARAGFILYLLLVHAWSFVLLFFHAHAVQLEGPEGQLSPHALMKPPPAVDVQALVQEKVPVVEKIEGKGD